MIQQGNAMITLNQAKPRSPEIEAMQKRLAGAKTNKMLKKPPARGRTKADFSNGAVK